MASDPRLFDDVLLPDQFEIATDQRVHRQPYIEFVSKAWNEWAITSRRGSALPLASPTRGAVGIANTSRDGKLGYN
jgi:hypothetical protein